jgi:hypothetical protein
MMSDERVSARIILVTVLSEVTGRPRAEVAGDPIMEHDRPRWRIRISTLMLLVIIAALSLALVVEHRKRALSEQLASANERTARYEADLARAEAQRALDQVRRAEAQSRRARDQVSGSMPRTPRDSADGTTVEPER